MKKNKILIVEDAFLLAVNLEKKLEKMGYIITNIVSDAEQTFNELVINKPDIIIMDIILNGKMDGIDITKKINNNFNIPVLFITGQTSEKLVARAKKVRNVGFLLKPIKDRQLCITLEMAFAKIGSDNKLIIVNEHKEALEHEISENRTTLKQMKKQFSLLSSELMSKIDRNFIGKSTSIKNVIKKTMLASKNPNANVILHGESGTGKEILARIIHHASARSKNFFCPVNSSAIPEALIESEFFGYGRGAFTGADSDKIGYFESANNGTIFLDEISDMPYGLQAKLLRVLEDKVITKIGTNKQIKLDFRVISATNQDLYKLIDEKSFRLDLFYRLNNIEIYIPPLRERKEDIPLLIKYYVNKFSNELNKKVPAVSKETLNAISEYYFPGNVRELKNMVENALIHTDSNVLPISSFNFRKSKQHKFYNAKNQSISIKKLSQLEKEAITNALDLTNNNKTTAANKLGISRDTLHRKIKKYQL
jgi:DNA-binding NtrC family response regulator